MSTLILVASLGSVTVGLLVGWALALRHRKKVRPTKGEDPRDQALRELRAALNVAQKNAEVSKGKTDDNSLELKKTAETLEQTQATLTKIQEKYASTRDNLNKELEEKEELIQELTQHRNDRDKLKAKIDELEVQLNVSTGPDLMAAATEAKLAEAQADAEALRSQMEMLRATSKGGDDKTEAAFERFQKATEEIRDLKVEISHLENQVLQSSKLDDEIKRLKESLKETDKLKEDVKRLEGETAQHEQLKAEFAHLQKRVAGTDKLKAEKDKLESKVGVLETTVSKRETDISQLEDIAEEAEKLRQQIVALETAAKEVGELRDKVASLEPDAGETVNLRIQMEQMQSVASHAQQLRRSEADKLKAELI